MAWAGDVGGGGGYLVRCGFVWCFNFWIPACAGMTIERNDWLIRLSLDPRLRGDDGLRRG